MTALILAAGGSGRRFGSDIPKQFHSLGGKPVYLWALERLARQVQQIAVAVPETFHQAVRQELEGRTDLPPFQVVTGGATRQDSVAAGFRALAAECQVVLVHDAARPFFSDDLVARVIAAARVSGAAIPAIPVTDTIKEVAGGRVVRTVDRSRLYLVQTPQGFRREILAKALQKADQEGLQGTDESFLVESLGVPVQVIAGEDENVKITLSRDVERLETLYLRREVSPE